MRSRGLALILAAALAAACGTRQSSSAGGSETSFRQFPVIQIPGMYIEPEDRAAYFGEHFWDSFLSVSDKYRCDSLTVNGISVEDLESQFSTFVSIIEEEEIGIGAAAVASLFQKVEAFQAASPESNVFEQFNRLADKYLYDPNSPFRNEDLYLPYLQGLVASPLTDPLLVPSYEHAARLCALNPVGSPAADFRFVDIAGRSHTLYGVKAEYTLLFFSNPGCTACKDIIDNLKTIQNVRDLLSEGRLAVVNVYIDEDIDAWRSYQEIYPKEWYNGYDPSFSIRSNLSYSVRAIPSLYLLDSKKNVIMKDAVEQNVFAFLAGL